VTEQYDLPADVIEGQAGVFEQPEVDRIREVRMKVEQDVHPGFRDRTNMAQDVRRLRVMQLRLHENVESLQAIRYRPAE
jgi:hypothetical protein